MIIAVTNEYVCIRLSLIFDDAGTFVSVKVVKGGADPSDEHGVDAITGGTITSNGVTSMLENTLEVYVPYFKKNSDIASI